MTRILTFVAVLMCSAVALAQNPPQTPAAKDANAKAFETLQGTWIITSFNGQASEAGVEVGLVVAGEKYHQTVGEQVPERGGLKIDASKKPIEIDLVITEGNDAGKTQLGVFEITGDKLTMKLGVPGETKRPTGLAAEEGFFVLIATKKPK